MNRVAKGLKYDIRTDILAALSNLEGLTIKVPIVDSDNSIIINIFILSIKDKTNTTLQAVFNECNDNNYTFKGILTDYDVDILYLNSVDCFINEVIDKLENIGNESKIIYDKKLKPYIYPDIYPTQLIGNLEHNKGIKKCINAIKNNDPEKIIKTIKFSGIISDNSNEEKNYKVYAEINLNYIKNTDRIVRFINLSSYLSIDDRNEIAGTLFNLLEDDECLIRNFQDFDTIEEINIAISKKFSKIISSIVTSFEEKFEISNENFILEIELFEILSTHPIKII